MSRWFSRSNGWSGRSASVAAVVAASLLVPAGDVVAQTPGDNVNMVAGTEWPGGDPFLQRQNEPSLAVSSRNPMHLLAGANDYRTIDLPAGDSVPGGGLSEELAGDAWLGLFKSFDGGASWRSVLIPGYPQGVSAADLASPIHGMQTAADATVRAGTNGLFYYSGIAFNRDTNKGVVFVSRFIDNNNKENGDPVKGTDSIPYIDTRIVALDRAHAFLDKPWIAVDVPRFKNKSNNGNNNSGNKGKGEEHDNNDDNDDVNGRAPLTCKVAGQSFSAGNVYAVYSILDEPVTRRSRILFSRSRDCGQTWSPGQVLSGNNLLNQGASVGVDPGTGAVYVAWRRFATTGAGAQTAGILVARSTNAGASFSTPVEVTGGALSFFDQGTSHTEFRTNALPSLAVSVDAKNASAVHIAFAARARATDDARIFLTSSVDGAKWSVPAKIDDGSLGVDTSGRAIQRGHQFMPQLHSSAGRLLAMYYDTRLDHLTKNLTPFSPLRLREL